MANSINNNDLLLGNYVLSTDFLSPG